ncbi:mucin-5AC [Bombyx mandarina]|uniref:protein-tyrosine-phosphatase n=1 Tax=Bombyx mandarina TaxID=7092 RepID=A0A6J2JB41_BOMMA|nr:mucin-5AC [Bombyx mandarina]
MESPVRICFGAALVVNLLLISMTVSSALSQSTQSTANDEKLSRYNGLNQTSWIRSSDASNELNPKDNSEEHTDKNAKYKDRGRIKFHSLFKSTTASPLRKASSTESGDFVIVTPATEIKKTSRYTEITKSVKKDNSPVSSTTPVAVKNGEESIEEYDDEDEEEERETLQKFSSNKFHESFFKIPSFGDDNNESSNNKVREDFSSPSYGFSSFFPKETSFGYGHNDNKNNFKSESFFDFDSDLTTPKNDFFDKKYQEISGSIIKKLETIKAKSPPPNITNVHKIVKENVGLERLGNNTPTNKSTVFIKNTKEIRVLDNEGAGSANEQLSDVHGTSIYYEMSVLSTETYAINHSNDDDCDNDTLPAEPTMSTSSEEELASIKTTTPTPIQVSTRPPFPDPTVENVSTLSSNYVPISTALPIFNSIIPVSTQNYISSTERVTRVFSSSFSRNRNYSKRLNLSGVNDSPNSVTLKTGTPTHKPLTRKFHYTTQRVRPVWMAPKRNVTKPAYQRLTTPTTIYSEHFNIKDKYTTTPRPRPSNKVTLTTVTSEIDPVLQSDVGGFKKVVHSHSISDNTIPSLWKRGSTKYRTSTATSDEVSNVSEMEIPPTSIVWALASLRSPSRNSTGYKTDDENELQKVGELLEKNETKTSTTTIATTMEITEEITNKTITEVEQNKLPWQSVQASTPPINDMQNETIIENKTERVTAESNILVQSSPEPSTTETDTTKSTTKAFKPAWVSATTETEQNMTEKDNLVIKRGFESITKLPSGITTPQDETEDLNQITTKLPKTRDDFEITTIRFSYVPTQTTETPDDSEYELTTFNWRPVFPTRTQATTIKDEPITTYRPKFITTTELLEESTTIEDTTPPVIELSSQIIENATEDIVQTTDINEPTIVSTKAIEINEATTIPNKITENIKTTTISATTEINELTTIKTTTTEFNEPTQPITTEATEINEPYTTPTTQVPTTKQITTETSTTTTTEAATEVVSETLPITVTKTTTTSTTTPPTTTMTTTPLEDTTTIVIEVVTEINTEKERTITAAMPTETPKPTAEYTSENIDDNEVIDQTTTPSMPSVAPTIVVSTSKVPIWTTTTAAVEYTTEAVETSQENGKIVSSTDSEMETTRAVSDLEDLTSYAGEMTTEASSRVLNSEDSGTGVAVAIAVSTIGVIALVLLIALLLVVRRRGRRGIYAQRCTPVSLDAYSLDSVSVGHRKGNQRLRASKRSYGNPAYDDEVTSHPMQYSALASFAMDIESITAEFVEIPSVSVRPEEVPPGCEDKNRYSNVLPLPETRVPLCRIGNDPTTEYINANYITGPGNIKNYYIACQAPLANTVGDFWRMIWEQNSRLVVMLTEYMENGVEKCYEYLPPSEVSDNKRSFGDFKIILKKREQKDKYAISSVQLINMSTRTWREIIHLWYFWPAKGVPDDYDSILDFLSEMRNYMKISQTAKEYDEEGVEVIYEDQNRSSFSNLTKLRSDDNGSGNGVNVYSPAKAEEMMRRHTNGTLGRMKAACEVEGVRPCVVTCASGAGRSAVLVALDVCARALAAGRADVPRAVRHLRAQRPHSLSNRHHYILLYKVLSEYGNKLTGGGIDTI